MIIAVTGGVASGKTHWIRQKLAEEKGRVTYFSPQTESFPIDRLYLQSEFPKLSFLSVGEESRLWELSPKGDVVDLLLKYAKILLIK